MVANRGQSNDGTPLASVPVDLSADGYASRAAAWRMALGMQELADGTSPEGKFLSQKWLDESTKFATSDDGSYLRSIRMSCYQNLLNTVDKKGRPIKHSTHGGKFFLDF